MKKFLIQRHQAHENHQPAADAEDGSVPERPALA
jgi:hypothetical protein